MRGLTVILLGLVLTSCLVQADSGPVHIVQPGATLWDIAVANGISWQELAALNKIKDPTKLQVGTRLRLPTKEDTYLVLSDGTKVVVTSEELDLLARVVHAEAGSEPFEGKVAVAAVILIRVRSSRFPNSVWEVLHQPGQFTPVEQGTLSSKMIISMDAVRRALAAKTRLAVHFSSTLQNSGSRLLGDQTGDQADRKS